MLDKKSKAILEIIDPRSAGYSNQIEMFERQGFIEMDVQLQEIEAEGNKFSLEGLYDLRCDILSKFDYDSLEDYYEETWKFLLIRYGDEEDAKLYVEGIQDALEKEIVCRYMQAWNDALGSGKVDIRDFNSMQPVVEE